MLPGAILPERTASSSASGIDAALVLPYLARLLTTRSGATPSRCAALSRMRCAQRGPSGERLISGMAKAVEVCSGTMLSRCAALSNALRIARHQR